MLKLSQLKRSAVISAVVGTVLTLTNQYEAVMGDQTLNLVKALITYAIPFAVSLISALLEKKRVMQEITVASKKRLVFLQEISKITEAAINGSAKNTGVGDDLLNLSTRVNSEIERLIAEA